MVCKIEIPSGLHLEIWDKNLEGYNDQFEIWLANQSGGATVHSPLGAQSDYKVATDNPEDIDKVTKETKATSLNCLAQELPTLPM